MKGEQKKVRGVYEKEPGSGLWWVCYFDGDGRKRRDKVGPVRDGNQAAPKAQN